MHYNKTSEEQIVVTPKKRGRPRKYKEIESCVPKRSPGRPRKNFDNATPKIKRARGRPRKYSILEKEKGYNNNVVSVVKKVDSGYLMKKLLDYFTKLLVIHNEMSKEPGKNEVVFKRLKTLDFQMIEVCKTIFSNEYMQ